MEPQVGSILEGKVTTITKFGAFVALEGGRSGLVHISEIANTFVNDVHDFLQEGQTVKVVVLASNNGKINLSIKKALPRPARPAHSGGYRSSDRNNGNPSFHNGGRSGGRTGGPNSGPRHNNSHSRSAKPQPAPLSGDQAFEDKLKQFLSFSEGKMADLNRNMDSKRGRRRK